MQAPGDAQRWYVVERAGRVLHFSGGDGDTVPQTFIDIRAQVDTSGEGGLLGMAFHPDYPRNRYIFLSYTTSSDPAPGGVSGFRSVISRFTASEDGQSLSLDSEWPLITLRQPYSNHNGGQIAFGPDSYMYFGLGDGGGAGDPKNHAQDTRTLFGTMLRLDVNVSESDVHAGLRYRIPEGQPFPGEPVCRNGMCPEMELNKCAATGCAEIFAWGLRNPWRWSFDRETKALWVGDVGQNASEEIDIVTRGGNYGWSCFEGSAGFKPERCASDAELIPPAAEYSHLSVGGASVTGGYVYRGTAVPGLQGTYLYADYSHGELFALIEPYSTRRARRILDTELSIVSFAEDAEGELYVLSVDSPSAIYRIVADVAHAGENCVLPPKRF